MGNAGVNSTSLSWALLDINQAHDFSDPEVAKPYSSIVSHAVVGYIDTCLSALMYVTICNPTDSRAQTPQLLP